MSVTLFSPGARLALIVLAAACALAAAILRARRARDAWTALAVLGAALPLCALGAEQLVRLAANAAAEGGDYNEWRWVVGAPWGRAGIALGTAGAALTAALGFWGTRRERRPGRRALLVALRTGACACALVLFLEPSLELRHVLREPNHLAILVDDSRSMELAERPGGPTRAARAAAFVGASAEAFTRLRERHILDFYSFSDGLLPSSQDALAAGAGPRGDATLLREALEQVRARYDGADLAGVVVVSDGVPTGRFAGGVADGASTDFLRGLGTRVHTAWAGRDGLVDLAIARIEAEEFAFVRTAARIDAIVRQTGLGRREVPVLLTRDGVPEKQVTVVLGGDAREARASFEIVPDRVGKHVFEVSVPGQDGEATLANNARARVIRVIRDKVRVLLVAGRPSWDERAVRGHFKADPNVDLISFFILRTPEDIQLVPSDEMSLIPFPTEELFEQQLGSFDVIVMMNFDYERYGIAPYLENIRAYVEQGGALAMIGGDLAFSSGGYFGTALAEAMPVELLPSREPGAVLSTAEFRPRLAEGAARHPIMQLRFERRDNEARWASLPPLEGVNLTAGPRTGATVLLEHPTLSARRGVPMPVLVLGEHGKGRTLALTTDSAWRWGFVAAGKSTDDGRAHDRFWENVVRWLIRDPELELLQVTASQAEYAQGAAPRVTARLVDRDYRPARGAPLTITLATPAGASRRTVLERKLKCDEAGELHLELDPLPPGRYHVTARATVGDKRVVAEDVFLVSERRDELETPAARQDALATIAETTGGRYLGAASALDASIPLHPPRVTRADRTTGVELWSRPYLFFLALGLLAAEWTLRRRSGYL